MPHNSPGLVFWCQRLWCSSTGLTPNGSAKYRLGRLKLAIFDQYLAISQKQCQIVTYERQRPSQWTAYIHWEQKYCMQITCYLGNVATNSGKVNKWHADHVRAITNCQHFVLQSTVLRDNRHHVMLQSTILQASQTAPPANWNVCHRTTSATREFTLLWWQSACLLCAATRHHKYTVSSVCC